MNKKQFVELAYSSGYCTKKFASEYATYKTEFTDDDFIAVYRSYNSKKTNYDGSSEYNNTRYRSFSANGKTTKRYD